MAKTRGNQTSTTNALVFWQANGFVTYDMSRAPWRSRVLGKDWRESNVDCYCGGRNARLESVCASRRGRWWCLYGEIVFDVVLDSARVKRRRLAPHV
ncbi:hypothetical protein Ae201684P_015293 [Aphanomyces euteiches]|uniref:Uncharacterized protein n=1 Tax=Aphanomyces euteiches TaxID=100861 RepID=A0A6G0XFT7_9STRA|nr:hypothetical protein Ae201684_005263 [Aphanomyces euteiches]KAH9053528.1 hypothetical protein Ae201684P_015293 [Aphanomyces euteiches]